jgi:hypothetical protein
MYSQSQVAELRTLLDRLHQRDIAMRSASATNAARAISCNNASSQSMGHGHYGFLNCIDGSGIAGPASDSRNSSNIPMQCNTMQPQPSWPIQQQQPPSAAGPSQGSWLDTDPTRHSGSDSAPSCNVVSQTADPAVNAGVDADATERCESVELGDAEAAADADADSEVDVYADQEHLWMGSPPMGGDLSP